MARFRWFRLFMEEGLPLADRIQRAAFAVTMLVVIAIGTTSLGLSLLEIPQEEEKQHQHILRILGERLGSDLGSHVHNVEELSHSSLVSTALTDSADRDAYLKPFLEGREKGSADDRLLLVDYKGRPVAGQLGRQFPLAQFNETVAKALQERHPQFAIHPESPLLLIAYPVLFPYSQEAIGVLVGTFDVGAAFSKEVSSLDKSHGFALIHGNQTMAQFAAPGSVRYFPARYRISVAKAEKLPDLQLEAYSADYEWMTPVLTRSVLYMAIGIAFSLLVWRISGRVAISLTRRLNRLAVACAGVAAGKPFAAEVDKATDEIGVLSRTLRQAILAYEEIHANLEHMVRQKTEALNESLERYQQAFEINTAIKLIIDPENGRIVDANEAACSFYGHSRNRLLELCISDLNILSQAEICEEMNRAIAGKRFYGNFRHRLASGEVRDVEVYSGPLTIGGKPHLHSIVHDITERKRAEAALRQAEEKYRSVVENIKEVVFQTDVQGRWTYLNRAWEEVTGFEVQDSMGGFFLDYVFPDDRERNQALFQPLVNGEKEYCRHDIRYRHRDGGFRWLEVFARLTRDPDGTIAGTSGTLTDVTERRAAEAQLRLAASVFQHSHEGIVLTDGSSRIVDVNEAFSRITGYGREEVIGRNPKLLKSGHHPAEFYQKLWNTLKEKGYWQGELWNRRKDGLVYPELLTISEVKDGNGSVSHYVGVFADISPIKLHEQQLERIAHYDALTQLPNRILLADRLRLALAQAKRSGTMVAVCYLDLDGFKAVNDQYGHAAGDKLLVEIAQRLNKSLRAEDTVARLGGDEFVLLVAGIRAAEECEEVLERVIHAVSEPVFIDGAVAAVSASIGVSMYPETGEEADVLLRNADQAMYEAKQAGKNRYQLFNPEQDKRLRSYRARLKELELAVEREEFVLYYQPKVNLRTGAVVGLEALLRWQHPTQGLMLPGAFLNNLGNAGLESRIDQWVLEHAIDQVDAWRRAGCRLPTSVNISAAYLESPDFLPHMEEQLASHPGILGLLELEILESTALKDIEKAARIISECRALGLPFALDDFGTGYSSLTYFRRLPADILKIDTSFVREMLENPDDRAIVQGIIGLTKAFGRQVVAEGVETSAHGEALLELGCEVVQGFGIARPMPGAEVPGWVAGWHGSMPAVEEQEPASVL